MRNDVILNSRKRRPTHPGAILREVVLPGAGMTQTELSKLIRVGRRTINELCRERRAMSVDMAYRLARVFGGSPRFWLNLQQAVDVWDQLQARRNEYARIKPIKAA
jgi:addiction module HigA family antidote